MRLDQKSLNHCILMILNIILHIELDSFMALNISTYAIYYITYSMLPRDTNPTRIQAVMTL